MGRSRVGGRDRGWQESRATEGVEAQAGLYVRRGCPLALASPLPFARFKDEAGRCRAVSEEADRWLAASREDLVTSELLADADRGQHAAFHDQQAAEKAFKAVLIEKEGSFPQIHDLVVLAEEVETPSELRETCRTLSQAYVQSRYPDVPGSIETEQAEALIDIAREVVEWATKRI